VTETFWPGGAIQAFVAGAIGAVLVVVGWNTRILILSESAALFGGLLVVFAVWTFVREGWKAVRRRSLRQ